MTDLLGVGITQEAATDYVRNVRRAAAGEIEETLYVLEGKIAQHLSGPIAIPRAGDPLEDEWGEIKRTLGRWAGNFTVDGRRMFAAGGSDGLDAYLDRYAPGAGNREALQGLCQDLAAVALLRDQRGAVMRDGLPDPETIAVDPYELEALKGPFDEAVIAVRELEESTILAEHWSELDYLTSVMPTIEPECVYNLDMPDPVGIKEIAERLGVKRQTVDVWLQRRLLPDATWIVGGRPAWNWSEIERWARKTGRLKDD